jgi:hypothetical protein
MFPAWSSLTVKNIDRHSHDEFTRHRLTQYISPNPDVHRVFASPIFSFKGCLLTEDIAA